MEKVLTVDDVIAATAGDNRPLMHQKKRKRLEKLTNEQLIAYQLRTKLVNACRDLDPSTAYTLYKQARATGLVPAADAVNHILCLLAGLGEPGSGCSRSLDAGSNLKGAVEIYVDAKQLGISIHEPSYSALIRCYSANDLPLDALELFRQLEVLKLSPKHRTFSPLLDALSRGHHLVLSFELFNSMADKYDLIPLEKDYTSMLRLCHELKDERFIPILENMMEDILVPTLTETTTVIREWFDAQRDSNTHAHLYRIFDAMPTAQGIFDCPTASKDVNENRYALRSVDLADVHRHNLIEQINAAAVDRSSSRKKPILFNPSGGATTGATTAATTTAATTTTATTTAAASTTKAGNDSYSYAPKPSKMVVDGKFNCSSWGAFLDWIKAQNERIVTAEPDAKAIAVDHSAQPIGNSTAPIFRSTGPFDVMVDGANVGYFKQNYAGAPSHIDYFQVDAMVRYLQSTGRRVLLVLHCRHLHPNSVPRECVRVIKNWVDEGLLLTAPAGSNDDWFWLYAALLWGCQVLTNDEMRDHHFRMLSPRYFNRWKERNQIHFSFEGGGRQDVLNNSKGQELGKKRIKLATDTAANVVQEQSYVRVAPYQKNNKKAHDQAVVGPEPEIGEGGVDLSTGDGGDSASRKRSLEEGKGKESECVGITGLRRRRIILHVPLYYSCRMQRSLPEDNLAYFFPLVEQQKDTEDVNDVGDSPTMIETSNTHSPDETVVSSTIVEVSNGKEGDCSDNPVISKHLVPIPAAPTLLVGDNAVPVVAKWMCCIKETAK